MPVRLRLQRHGRRKRPFYHIVAADARAPRDGKFIEKLGTYNPMTVPATIDLDRMAAYKWLTKGAQPSDTVRAILRFKGVMYYKHLMRGVTKGALTQEEASEKWSAFIEAKEGKISARREAEAQRIADFHNAVAGEVPVIKEPEPVVVEAAADPGTEEAEAVEPSATAELDAAMAEAAAATAAPITEETKKAAADVAGEAKAEAEAAAAANEALEEVAEKTEE
ncbi:MAG: 30S ribosomal protein S16 [Bacteroidota bacterium]